MGLPLLRLPHLVITNLVDITGIDDLTCLSLCSKRARTFLMTCRRRKRFEKVHILTTVYSWCTVVYISECLVEVIQISKLESYIQKTPNKDCQLFSNRTVASVKDEIGNLETVKIEGHRVPFFRYSEVLLTFWESEAIGFKKCTDFFEKQMEIPFMYLEFARNGIWAFELVNQRDSSPLICTVEVFGMGDLELEYILKNCRSPYLNIQNEKNPTANFPSKSFLSPDMSLIQSEIFIVSPCNWLKMEDLITSNFLVIDLEKTNMTSLDLNSFLLIWIEGGFPRLQSVFIELCEPIQIETVANGMENDFRNSSNQHEFSREGCESFPYHQFDIQRRGGRTKTASVRFHSIQNSMLMDLWD